MATKEERVRADIITKFGSIPKMSRETGMHQNTIYHALERGLDNTTSKTRDAILEALYGNTPHAIADLCTNDERELLNLYRKLTDNGKRALVVGLREYAGSK